MTSLSLFFSHCKKKKKQKTGTVLNEDWGGDAAGVLSAAAISSIEEMISKMIKKTETCTNWLSPVSQRGV